MNEYQTTEIEDAKKVLKLEADSILKAKEKLDDKFIKAIDILHKENQKIVVTAIGKSGHLGKKLAATLCSTGSPAAYLHPSEAVHGDLGIHQVGDPVIFLSNSGSTPELIALEPVFRSRGAKIVGIIGKKESPLAAKVDSYLDASVSQEADPLDIVPTASVSVASALGDALSSALMKRRNFSEKDYAQTHPAGQLGRNLILRVRDVMHGMNKIAMASPATPISDIVVAMTEKQLGAACIVNEDRLVGIITDGDLRRTLKNQEDPFLKTAEEIMNPNPRAICPETRLGEALQIMEEGKSQISVLPVTEENDKVIGLIRIHDIFGENK